MDLKKCVYYLCGSLLIIRITLGYVFVIFGPDPFRSTLPRIGIRCRTSRDGVAEAAGRQQMWMRMRGAPEVVG